MTNDAPDEPRRAAAALLVLAGAPEDVADAVVEEAGAPVVVGEPLTVEVLVTDAETEALRD